LSHNQALAAVVGTWAEFLAYYGVIVAGDLRAQQQRSPGTVLATLRNIVLEFGLAELLDSTLIRPAALYAGMTLVPSLPLGIVAGKLVADLIFYLPTITSYELLRRQRAQA
jgi:hypothetical protein